VLLPPDASGATIVYGEETRLEPYMFDLWKSRARVVWYLTQAGYTSGERQAHCYSSMYACDTAPLNGHFRAATRHLVARLRRVRKAMPISGSSIYLLTRPSKTGNAFIIQIMLTLVSNVLGKLFSSIKVLYGAMTHHPTGNADAEDAAARGSLRRQLQEAGFTRTQIPDWSGGQFTLDDFRAWIRRRSRTEQKLFWTDGQRALQVRGLSRIKSQRKRQRRRQDILGLEVQVQRLKAENARAKHEEKTLSLLLREAQEKTKAMQSVVPELAQGRQPTGFFGGELEQH
jgi:roadblock/LC7 domain-containing protein